MSTCGGVDVQIHVFLSSALVANEWSALRQGSLICRQYPSDRRLGGPTTVGLNDVERREWPESASELYRPSDRRLQEKFVPTFVDRGLSGSQSDGSLRPYSRLSRQELLLFLPSSSQVLLTRLSGPRSRTTTTQKIWWSRESNPDLWICSLEL
jgi:hypothetical protein